MKRKIRIILKILLGICLLISFGFNLYLRFSNPTMTETQLFINYGYLWLITILFVGVFVALIDGLLKGD
jgi:polyferredoxin